MRAYASEMFESVAVVSGRARHGALPDHSPCSCNSGTPCPTEAGQLLMSRLLQEQTSTRLRSRLGRQAAFQWHRSGDSIAGTPLKRPREWPARPRALESREL